MLDETRYNVYVSSPMEITITGGTDTEGSDPFIMRVSNFITSTDREQYSGYEFSI
jgi:hypothetical protein